MILIRDSMVWSLGIYLSWSLSAYTTSMVSSIICISMSISICLIYLTTWIFYACSSTILWLLKWVWWLTLLCSVCLPLGYILGFSNSFRSCSWLFRLGCAFAGPGKTPAEEEDGYRVDEDVRYLYDGVCVPLVGEHILIDTVLHVLITFWYACW